MVINKCYGLSYGQIREFFVAAITYLYELVCWFPIRAAIGTIISSKTLSLDVVALN